MDNDSPKIKHNRSDNLIIISTRYFFYKVNLGIQKLKPLRRLMWVNQFITNGFHCINQSKEEIQLVKSFDSRIIQLNDKLEKVEKKYLFDDFPRQKHESHKSALESELLQLQGEKENLKLEISNLNLPRCKAGEFVRDFLEVFEFSTYIN